MTRNQFPIARLGRRPAGFTLTELLVSMFVLLIIVFFGAQMMTTTTAITRGGNKHISTDTQARAVLDRIALDFAQMLKRTDVDYYVKGPVNYQGHGNGHGWGRRLQTGQQGSDQIAFFTQVPGYYPSSGAQSPFSLVAYRVNQSTNTNPAWMRLERLSKGLPSNGYDPGNNPGTSAAFPIVFLPQTISGVGKPWSAALNNGSSCGNNTTNSCDSSYEVIGPGVFRFEYYYILKNGLATDVPWDRVSRPSQTSLTSPVQIGLTDVESIAVVIAVMDPEGRALMDANASIPNSASMVDLASDLTDFVSAHGRGVGQATKYIGQVESDWETTIETWASTGLTSVPNNVPKAVASAVRIYSRSFDLKTLPTF
jgi:prepilin-type N-terminal cleavage/methylation domain-containing protein